MFQVLGYLLFGSLFYHNFLHNGSGSSFNDMSSFIEKQQYREDQLREQCNLQHYKLKEKPGLSDKIKESIYYMKESISSGTGDISKNLITIMNYSPVKISDMAESNTDMSVHTLEEFMNMSHDKKNVGKNIIYDGTTYKLMKAGFRISPSITYMSYSHQHHLPDEVEPIWRITLGSHELTITDIK